MKPARGGRQRTLGVSVVDLWRRMPKATWRRTGAVERCRELGKRMEEDAQGTVGPWRHRKVRLCPHRESHGVQEKESWVKGIESSLPLVNQTVLSTTDTTHASAAL